MEISLDQWVWLSRKQKQFNVGIKNVEKGIQDLEKYVEGVHEGQNETKHELWNLGHKISHLQGHTAEFKCLEYQYAIFSPLQGSETVVLDNTGITGPRPIVQPEFIPSFYTLQKASLAELRTLHMTQISLRRDINLYCLGFKFSDGSNSPPEETYPQQNQQAGNWLSYEVPTNAQIGKIVFGVYKKKAYRERLGLCRLRMFEKDKSLLCDVKGNWKDRETIEVALSDQEKFVSAKIVTRQQDPVNISFIIFDENKQTLLDTMRPFDAQFTHKVDQKEHEYQGGYEALASTGQTIEVILEDTGELRIIEEEPRLNTEEEVHKVHQENIKLTVMTGKGLHAGEHIDF